MLKKGYNCASHMHNYKSMHVVSSTYINTCHINPKWLNFKKRSNKCKFKKIIFMLAF